MLGMISVYALMKELSFSSKTSYKCSFLYFVLPFILTQITTTYIDGIGCTVFILLLYWLIKILKTNKLSYEISYFILLSIFMGIKGTYVIYAVIMSTIYVIYKIYMVLKKKEKIVKLLLKELLYLCIVLTVGCTWMIQNIIIFKNPIHPFKFLGIQGMDANIDIGVENEPYCLKGKNDIEKIVISWIGLNSSYLTFDTGIKKENLYKDYDSRIGGMGIEWLYFLIPCCVIAILLCLLKKYKINKWQLLVILVSIVCFIVTPANWWARYAGFIVIIGYIAYGIIDSLITEKKKCQLIFNIILVIVLLASTVCSTKEIFKRLLYTTPYSEQFSSEFRNYIETGNKNIIVLEESYYESTRAYVFLKGSFLQNHVDTYYIKEMYPNASVKNHGIENYENFKEIVNKNNLDAIIILDSDFKRENYNYLEKYYKENSKEYTKKEYGDGIIVYEKIK